MGYRHQFWAVAQINGRYRTLAIAHSYHCGDTSAVQACSRLLQIFGSEKNRTLLLRDLDHAARQELSWWGAPAVPTTDNNAGEATDGDEEKMASFPCVATCLFLGAAFDSRPEPEPYLHPVYIVPHNLSPTEIHFANQSGCTIIDITDLQNLRYCFLFYPNPTGDEVQNGTQEEEEDESEEEEEDESEEEEEDESEEEKQNRLIYESLKGRPLTAEAYLACPILMEHDVKPDVHLGSWRLLTSNTLRDLWPQLAWPDLSKEQDEAQGQAQGQAQVQAQQQRQSQHQHDGSGEEGGATLWASSGISETDLLRQIQPDRETLDFSPFPQLSEPAVAELLETLSADCRQVITRVDISGNRNIGSTLVAKLLDLYPNIAVLTLLHTCPRNLSLASLHDLLANKDGGAYVELHHSELFSAAFTRMLTPVVSGDKSGSAPYQSLLGSLPNYHAPGGTVNRVLFLSVQMEDDIPKPSRRFAYDGEDFGDPYPQPLRLPGGGLRWSNLLAEKEFTAVESGWIFPFFHADIPLQDAFLDPRRLSEWLPRLLSYFATHGATIDKRYYQGGYATLGCACALAMGTEADWSVAPIPATAVTLSDIYKDGFDVTTRMMPIDASGWTLLILTEEDIDSSLYRDTCDVLRYAFVTRDASTGRVITCGPAGFYARATGQDGTCEMDMRIPEAIRGLVRECGPDEAEEVTGPFMEKREQLVKLADEKRSSQAFFMGIIRMASGALDQQMMMMMAQKRRG
ncbi:hypothetical protein B0T25DRAFT_554597 [Lasiosphaeria hispida]|uniref:Uncharacterized protein n=1 Tax=Lasiosphaeria hispida TaxID=260671 RepID=A0AAJ0M925_9PEZI|nr:hypothetical protein B0T25DRAFT_554597 [Lasiosphaeria hispida]